ncbi:hypothetical protein [Pseudomonas corrugata]|uniref:hypothetical protein n=1 Tax=Pseudomonas corrugata TaxID=47879 RepID=UPI0006D88926|nr:hypothetical protein [Pseudomonas corrugata]
MVIDLPDIAAQQAVIFQEGTKAAIAQLKANLDAPRLAPQTEVDENQYPRTHLLREREGWEAPHPDIIGAYFRHFQANFKEFGTDAKLADLLGLSTNRRVRAFKEGSTPVPYGVWRHFLVMTGRVPQDVIPVLAFMG